MTGSRRAGLADLAAASRLGAAALVALAAVRLALVAVLGARPATAPLPAQPPARPSATASARLAPSSRGVRARKAKRAGTPGKPALMNLAVTVGGRAGVYVDHAYMGKSPYIGEVSCRVGGTVTIQILPAKGAPRVFKRTCVAGGTIEIGD